MPDDNFREVYRQARTSQDKYAYFMLAAAGAAIAFALNQTQESTLSWPQIFLGGAVLSWGVSFWFGRRHITYMGSNLYANLELLRVQAGEHPMAGNHPQAMEAVSQAIRESIKDNAHCAGRNARWQWRCLIFGAILYTVWHVVEMWERTTNP